MERREKNALMTQQREAAINDREKVTRLRVAEEIKEQR